MDHRLACENRPTFDLLSSFILRPYGSASTLKKNLNEPADCTPSRNCKLTLAPGASGEPSVIVAVVTLLLKPPPKGCAGGVSRVVPRTVTLQGVVAKPAAVHVAGSLTLTVM